MENDLVNLESVYEIVKDEITYHSSHVDENSCVLCSLETVLNKVNSLPRNSVQSAYWDINKMKYDSFQQNWVCPCSKCGYEDYKLSDFCPGCGRRMKIMRKED